MDRGRQRRILILLTAAALCLIMARVAWGGRRDDAGSLSLWYVGGDCPGAVMDALAARCLGETGLLLETRVFADEASMGLAFEEEKPDLVFCSAARAARFEERESLDAAEDALPLPETLRETWAEIGSSFFPIGGRLPLLLVNTALVTETHESLEALLEAAGDTPFLTSHDWAELLYTAMSAAGKQMMGDPAADVKSKVYRALWNELAGAAFRGGLVTSDAPADYARQGLIPCAVVSSAEIAGLTDRNIYVRPLPLPTGAAAQYPAEPMGFALPEGADTEAAASFLRWLYAGRMAGETAVAAGLIPITEAADARTGLETALIGLSRSGLVRWDAPDAVFYRNRESCEAYLEDALSMLE